MQIILYLSVALIAIAFFVLVIFLSTTLKSFQVTLTSVSKTLAGLEKQLDGVTAETTVLLQKTNALADDLKEKTESLTSVVDAVKDVGTTVNKFNGTLKNITKTVDIQVEESKEKISQIVQWSNVILELKDKWQARKQQKSEISVNEGKKVRSH
ncbi:DUF948 domain-containing protein [Neobacillus sp. MER 74]|uniref:DUF948 domain-containing protein n=1 Tax=Bacillaceae TaxID=186817 RepID=UPI000BF9B535|nr:MULTISPECIES: DUF948 domain-containing protein [Bacillaceae]MCM3116600.1 DUF948 domain-containing protein [Neobacillus sp. MER 74]PFP27842.1 DUF948 domain containing protein [Bacillus sp. AFS073361]